MDGKVRTGKSKAKQSQTWLFDVALIWSLLHSFITQFGSIL